MTRKIGWLVLMGAVLSVASSAVAASALVSSFESGLEGWYTDTWTAGTVSLSATGATEGAQAMQVEAPGGWQQCTKVNAKPHMAALATKGAKITIDATAFAADMTTTWMQVGMVINSTAGVGWIDLGLKDLARDGQPHKLEWLLPDDATTKIAGADDSIGWFEILLISNVDGASVAKFYVDNVQISTPDATSTVLVSNFEGDLDGWAKDQATALSFSTTGATLGAQALQVDAAGGWKLNAKLNAKPYMATLGKTGAKIVADVTAFEADMTTTWMQVEFVINAQNDDQTGPQNNIGWVGLGGKDVIRDGQPHTYEWELPDALTGKISLADQGIWWFEFALVSNVDGASATKFYIDNIRIVTPKVETAKSTDFILGNWEQDLDRWVVGGEADVLYSDVNGVTLDNYSIDIWVPTGAWAAVLTMDLLEPNNADILAAFRANTKITADITHLVADWPVGQIPPWNGTHFVINTDAGYLDLGYRAGWTQNDGDRTDSVTWDYSQQLGLIDFDNLTYLQFHLIVNANSENYTGWVWFYIDNMKLSGGGIALNPQPASGAKDVNTETQLSWQAGAHAESHNLYLGTNSGKVASADGDSDPDVLFVPLDGTSFDPENLDFNTQYYWRVDAVNDANPDSPWKGVVWNFTTGNFLVVDDFEKYEDVLDGVSAIFDTWKDGYGNEAANGCYVGNADVPYAKDAITAAHGGDQLMPFYYDNTVAPISEATRTWDEPQDWTVNGFNCLKFFIAGKLFNKPGVLYVTVKDSAGVVRTVERDISDLVVVETWTELEFPVSEFAGVNLAAVKSMTIGIKNKTGSPKAEGTLLIDDIRVAFKAMGLVAHYKLEGDLLDSSGNGFHGTFGGDDVNHPAKYVAGPTGFGQGMLFDGAAGHQNVELGTFNPSAATGQLTVALWAKWDGLTDQWQGLIGKRDGWDVTNMYWDIEANRDTGSIGFRRIDSYPDCGGQILPIGVWTHIAATFDGTRATFYINGTQSGNGGNFSFGQDKEAGLHFGSVDPNGGNPFNGALDDVRLYDKALSADEVKALMSN